MWAQYERETYRFLSVYRFFSYAVAVVFLQLPSPLTELRMPPAQVYILIASLGIYTLLKIFSPVRWREGSPMAYAVLVGDFLLCLTLVIFTNGLNSVFIFYSLAPVLTAALLFEEKVALGLASIASVTLSAAHLVLSQIGDPLTGLLQAHNRTILILSTFFALAIATVPYRTNLNIRRRIEEKAVETSLVQERRRLAREVHDGVAQSLGYLNLKTRLVSDAISSRNSEQAIGGLREIQELVKHTYEDVRESIDRLSGEVRRLPLVPALADYTKEFASSSNIQVRFAASRNCPRLPPGAELQVLRIAQEALANVRKHAQASEVTVSLQNTPHTVELVIKDNGRGFSPAEREGEQPADGHHGLKMIRERAEEMGGALTISSSPGQGTEVRLSIPFAGMKV